MWFWLFLGGVVASAGGREPDRGGTVPLRVAKRMKIKAMPVQTQTPGRMAKETDAERLARWQLTWEPAYIHFDGCKSWYWGFNVGQIAGDAAAYGGATIVQQIMDWIMSYTALGELVDWMNFKFRFELSKYSISTRDQDGAWSVTASQRKRIADWTARGDDVPPVPTAPAEAGWTRCWVAKQRGGVYAGEDDGIITVIRPVVRDGPVYAGEGWEFTWLIATKELRALLRHDKIDLSTIARQQCGDGRWYWVSRKYADEVYK